MAARAERRRHWPARPSPLVTDALVGYLVTMAVGVALFTSQRVAITAVWPAYGFAFGFGVVLLWRRRHPVPVLLLTSIGICAYYTFDYPPIGLALPIAAALFSAAEAGHLRAGMAVSAALVTLAVYFQAAGGTDLAQLLGYQLPPVVALMGAALALGDGTRTRRLLRAAQRERERQARLELEHRAAEQRAAERLGLARDLHDTLGHHLSVISLHSAVAEEALPERVGDADRAVREVHRVGRQAMKELRETVNRLRSLDEHPDPSVGLDHLPELVESARRSGLRVSSRHRANGVPEEVGQAAYFIVQEAVTNVIRHADATAIDIEVSPVGGRLLVTVDDNGYGHRQPDGGTGEVEVGAFARNGIRGMVERAGNLGGQVTVSGREPGPGTRVTAEIPLKRAGQRAAP